MLPESRSHRRSSAPIDLLMRTLFIPPDARFLGLASVLSAVLIASPRKYSTCFGRKVQRQYAACNKFFPYLTS